MKGYDMKIMIWKDHVPKVDRIPVVIASEEEGKMMTVVLAEEKANEHKLEVSTALYQGERYIASHRAFPAPSVQ
ncbi:hypothetical protein KJ866_02230 [Patescibacteria group bacterium]|nr:hypothetical protein [Patescibacteria group bacterium]MBU2220063.1 hypothetical protein [Patescibacteria group bacterium]